MIYKSATQSHSGSFMLRIVRLVLRFARIFLNGLRFAALNRDLQPEVVRSCVEYWRIATWPWFAKLFGRAHCPERPVNMLGMKLYSFSPDTLLFLMDEIFFRREYAFTSAVDEPLIIDCGSNIGISILFFKKLLPKARVIGFEPDKKTFELLSRNIVENGLSHVSLHNAAVSSRTGEVTFFSDPQNLGSPTMSTVRERIAGEGRQVPCVALSSFVKEPVDLLKMDIEGAEMDVMRGLAGSGALKNVKAMVIEYHHHIKQEEALSEMLHLLEQHSFGYDVRAALPATPGKFQDILLRVYTKRNAL
jgi:FkbM family methyltransferase